MISGEFLQSLKKNLRENPLDSQYKPGEDIYETIAQAVFIDKFKPSYWIIIEGDELPSGDWNLFGYMKIIQGEWGTVYLSELLSNDDIACYVFTKTRVSVKKILQTIKEL